MNRVWYFTAMVSARPDDPFKPQRQQTYLRALRTLEEIRIELGQFVQHNKIMPLVKPIVLPDRTLDRVRVIRTDEKGSDVNLATRLLHEAHLDLFDVAVVMSNDSDLVAPVKLVRQEIGKRVGLINPHPNPSRELLANVDFVKQLRSGPLKACRLPDTLEDAAGPITCPTVWLDTMPQGSADER